MTSNIPDASISKIARIAGLAYVLIIVDAALTLIFVDPNYGSADIAATIDKNPAMFVLFFRFGEVVIGAIGTILGGLIPYLA